MKSDNLLVTAKKIDSDEEVTGYYYKHEGPLHAFNEGQDREAECQHFIFKTGFADWNMRRPMDAFKIDPTTLRKANE